MKTKRLFAALFALFFTAGCRTASSTAELPPVKNFDLSRYCGVWYEIARLPHSFEKNMTKVKTTYTLREDGRLDVLNEGMLDGKDKTIKGIGRFKDDTGDGNLEVCFFWPFYGDYKIIELDDAYSVAVVTSSTKDYFWILSRTPRIPDERRDDICSRAAARGFDMSKLIIVEQ